MSDLLIGDLHLTDRPRDAYRFDIFKWIRKQQAEFKPKRTIFMGDLTDKKDKHSSTLVNRIIDELLQLENFYVLMGNHDYVDPGNPFFKFVGPNFLCEPTVLNNDVFIPHCKRERDFENICRSIGNRSGFVFLHQTFDGAIAETGVRLSGFKQSHLEQMNPKAVYCGDVHKPQRSGIITYVGAPYHIKFGDDFDPRCILLDNGQPKNLYFETVRKWNLLIQGPNDILKNKALFKGDQVKLTLDIRREDVVNWKTHRQIILEAAKSKGLDVFGVDVKPFAVAKHYQLYKVGKLPNSSILNEYCRVEKVPTQIKKMGQVLMEA